MTDERTLPGDLALRRALDYAPDHAAAPGEELDRAILGFAHEAVAPSLPGATPGFFGRGRARVRGNRRRRNTALVALLIGVLAIATWQRELMPGARQHVDVPTTAPTPAEVSPSEQRTPESGAAPASPSVAASGPAGGVFLPGFAPAMSPVPELPATAAAPAPKIAPSGKVPGPAVASAPVSTSPTPPAAPAALSKSAVPASPSAPVTPPGSARNAPAERVAAVPSARAGAVPAVTARTAETPPPTFAALSQWTHLTLTRVGGESRTLPKSEVRELGALLGSAALAGVGPEALTGRVDWRIALHRNSETIARIELTGSQVRWRENGAPPGTGTPPPGALAGLRRMLEAVFEEPAASAGSPAAPATATKP